MIKITGVPLQAPEASLLPSYLMHALDPHVHRPYVLVVIQPQILADQIELKSLKQCARSLPAKYSTNLKLILVREACSWVLVECGGAGGGAKCAV